MNGNNRKYAKKQCKAHKIIEIAHYTDNYANQIYSSNAIIRSSAKVTNTLREKEEIYMKKKMITALLASAMVLSLVACGGGGIPVIKTKSPFSITFVIYNALLLTEWTFIFEIK